MLFEGVYVYSTYAPKYEPHALMYIKEGRTLNII